MFIKFSNTLVLPDPEPPMIKILKGWSGKTNSGYDLFQLIHNSSSSSFKFFLDFLVVV